MSGATRDLLVVMPSWIGDVVMATPALAALAEQRPELAIRAVARPGLGPVLEGLSWLGEVETATLRGVLGPLGDARRLSGRRPDAVLLLPNSLRSGLFARLLNSPRRIGYAVQGRGWLLSEGIPYPSDATSGPTTTLQDYCRLVETAFGIRVEDRVPRLGTTPDQEAEADRILEGIEGPLILLNPGANRRDKRWSPGNFAELADRLRDRYPHSIAVNGSPAEAGVLEEVCGRAGPGVVNLSKRGGSLGALKAVVRKAELMVTNDTGPRHLAAALGTPSVVLFGPTDRRFTVLEGIRERHLVAEPFLTADRLADDHPRACRIDRISVGDVVHAVEDLLGGKDKAR